MSLSQAGSSDTPGTEQASTSPPAQTATPPAYVPPKAAPTDYAAYWQAQQRAAQQEQAAQTEEQQRQEEMRQQQLAQEAQRLQQQALQMQEMIRLEVQDTLSVLSRKAILRRIQIKGGNPNLYSQNAIEWHSEGLMYYVKIGGYYRTTPVYFGLQMVKNGDQFEVVALSDL
jgi:ribosomal protein S25